MSFNDLRMNPEYPYLQAQLEARRHESQALIRVATREGRADHPAVQIARGLEKAHAKVVSAAREALGATVR